MKNLISWISRQPVVIGGAVIATVEAAFPDMSPAWKIAIGGWVMVFQKSSSTSKLNIEDEKQNSYNAALADVDSLAGKPGVGPPPLPKLDD